MDSVVKKPIRILHIVGGMDTGGVETWLMHVLRRIDRSRYKFDFLVHADRPCFYDDEIRSLGCRIIPCLHPSRPLQFAINFLRILKNDGPYDVVHSHVHHFSGFTLLLARLAGVPMRVAHSHNDTSLNDGRARFWRRLYLRLGEFLIRHCATEGLACSERAAASLFGKNWEHDPRWRVLYCGIDLEPFAASVSRDEVRRELGIPSGAFVVGHVGRFSEQKNHNFLLDVFAEVVRNEPKVRLLLVGDGPLREKVEKKAEGMGLSDKVIFAGVRSDVSRLMLGAMDVFVFPSHHEGLPLALIEAQAAGLSAVISGAISHEIVLVPELVKALSLNEGEIVWARAVTDSEHSRRTGEKALLSVKDSRFNVIHSATELCELYLLQANRKG